MAIHRRLDSFSLIFYLLLILWVKTELHQNLPPITSGFQLLRSLSANKHFCRTSRAAKTLYLSWFFLVDPMRLSSKEQKILQKNKPYKAFSRFQTDLNLVGLDCLLYIILILYRLQWRIFQDFLELFYCHSSVFRCFFNRHTALSHLLNQHPHLTNANAFGLYPLTKVAHNKHLSFQFFVHCNAKFFFKNFPFLCDCSGRME